LSSKAEPEGRIGGASQESDTKTAGGSVEAKAKGQDPKEAGRWIESASWRSTERFSRKVDRQRKLGIDRKAAEGRSETQVKDRPEAAPEMQRRGAGSWVRRQGWKVDRRRKPQVSRKAAPKGYSR